MAYGVRLAENTEYFEVHNEEGIDRPRIDPHLVQTQIKLELRHHLKVMIEEIAEAEADEQIGAVRYERGVICRADYRNGYRQRMLGTSLGSVEVRVPRARKTELTFSVFTKYRRRWEEVDELLVEAHIGGLSCRAAGERIAGLIGCSVSGGTIAKLKKALEEKLRSFKHAELKDEYKAIIIDGMFVRIKQCGRQKRPLIVAIGIKKNGEEDLLGMKVCYSENSVEVEGLLRSIKERGVKGVNLDVVTIDGDKGLENAVCTVYGNVRIQSCTFHKINRLHQNAQSKKRGRVMMQEAAKAFSEDDPRKKRQSLLKFCDKWRKEEPGAIELFEKNLNRCFEADCLPKEIRSKATTTGHCENFFKQLRARINQIGAFENPLSVETYVYGIVCQKKWVNIPGRTIGDPLLSECTHSS
jgi:transposase-like protein